MERKKLVKICEEVMMENLESLIIGELWQPVFDRIEQQVSTQDYIFAYRYLEHLEERYSLQFQVPGFLKFIKQYGRLPKLEENWWKYT